MVLSFGFVLLINLNLQLATLLVLAEAVTLLTTADAGPNNWNGERAK
jgi:hypothetical protein